MNLPIRYAALLSLLLVAMFVRDNPVYTEDGGSTVRVFPYLLAVFSIPVVIAALIWHIFRRAGAHFTWQIGVRSGELAARWTAAFFAFGVIMYSTGFYAGRLSAAAVPLVLWGGSTAFVMTYLVGLASAILVAIVVRRMGGGTTAS